MASDLGQNLKDIREEARLMLKNITKVRGKRYSTAVQTLLLIKQVADVSFMLCSIVADEREDVATAAADSLEDCLTGIGCNLGNLSNFDDQEWQEIVRDAETLSQNVSHLLRSAVSAHRHGTKFGEH